MKASKMIIGIIALLIAGTVFAGGGSQQAEGAGPVKLTYWEMNWGPADMEKAAMDKLVKKFNDSHPNIEVEVQYIPWEGYYQTFLTAVTSGNAPDVATGATPQPIQYAVMGESLDLDPIMEAWRNENNPILTDITPDLWKFFQYQGKQYGIAFGLDLKLFIYRKDFFQQAGITTMPKTWPEFTAVLEKLKARFPDKIPLLMPGADSGSNHSLSMFLGSNLAGFTTPDLKPAFQSKATMECLNYVKELYDKQLVGRGTAGYSGTDAERMFAAGEACILGGMGFANVAGKDIEKNCAVMPPLTGPSARQGSMIYCPNGIMGFSQTKHPDETRTFIKWWMENFLEMISESGQSNFPARRSYMQAPFYQSDPLRSDSYKYMFSDEYSGVSMIYPAETLYPQFSQIEGEQLYGAVLRKIVTGISPAQAAREGDAAIQQAIDTYK